jgi:uncharacterized RDD family membrane protein YckC
VTDSLPILPIAPGPHNYALWASRLIAALIDAAITMVVVIILFIIFSILGAGMSFLGSATGSDDVAGAATCLGCLAFLILPAIANLAFGFYNKVHLVGTRGASIGQAQQKLRVVTPTGDLVPKKTLILRLIIQTVFIFLPIVPFVDLLWPLWDEKRQTLHDKAVDTYVISLGS